MDDPSTTYPGLMSEMDALKQRIQELEQSEAELKARENLYRVLFEDSPYGCVVIDPLTAAIVEFNEAAHRQLGYSRAEFAGLTVHDVEIIESPEQTRRHIENVMYRGRDDFQTLHRTRQGEIRKVHVTAQKSEVSGRTVYHCVWTDITERTGLEEELLISTNRLSRAEIISRCGNWEFNFELNLIFASEGARNIYGITGRDWTIHEVQKIPLPEYREMLNEALRRLISENRPYNVKFKIKRPDTGEIVYIHSVAEYDRERNVAFGVIRDITEYKRTEDALSESEAKYRTLIENSLAGVYIFQDDRFRFVNNRFCEILGYTCEELADTLDSLDILEPATKLIIRECIAKFLEGETENISLIQRAVRKDGAAIVVSVLGRPMMYGGRPAVSGTAYDITEHEEAEEQVRQKTALLEAQVNASLDGILVTHKGRKILQNRQMEDLFRIPPDIAESDDRNAQIEWEKGLLKNPDKFMEKIDYIEAHPNETLRDELEFKDGTVLDRFGSPIIGKDGTDYGRIWTFRDITGRKKSEEALLASRVQLSEAMDLAHIVYWEFDSAAQTFIFNDPFYAFYGTTSGQEGGYRMTTEEYARRFVHPDDIPRYTRFVEENTLRPDPASVIIAHRIIRRDGQVRHIMARSRIVMDDLGRIVKRYGANQDVTEYKDMEKAVRESGEQFRKIFERSPLGMVTAGIDLRLIRANAAFCKMLGYTEQELASLTFKDITHPEHLADDASHVKELITGKSALYRTEKRYIRKDGGIVWGSSTVTLMRDSDGRFMYSLITVEDVTHRKESEKEQARLETQLQQAQKMEAIGTLAGGVAHDFNNILTVITGYGAMLKMDLAQNDPLRTYVDSILSSAEKAAHLTRSLLSFSRQQPIRLSHLNLNECLRSAEKLLMRLLTENIAIKTVLTAEEITIMADPVQIDQIILNMATNARDAMPKGGVLTMETKIVELDDQFRRFHGYGEPGRYILLSLSDTGVGMDEATRERIFDPFFTTKETGKGTGLGLSTVYGIVRQHNGYITVYSEPNLGTSFHIYLPMVSKAVEEERKEPAPVRGGNETILVAEDNESVRSLICRILGEYGYTTIEAGDGEEAVEQFGKMRKIDLLVFDSVMPKKSGREAYDEIRRMKPGVKVLFTSGYTRDVILDKGVEDKKFEFVPKPISPGTLLQKVREMLDEQGPDERE
ncbi:MAG TPA: PAS domain S-box protein [Syntrophorhabdaceae bacterium]